MQCYTFGECVHSPNLSESHGLSVTRSSPSLASLRRCSPRPRTRCTGSTTTRLVTSADISSASLQRPLRRIASRSYVVRLRVVSAGVYPRTLTRLSSVAAGISVGARASLSRRFGASGRLSSIVFTRTVHGSTHSLVCSGVEQTLHWLAISSTRVHTCRCRLTH